MTSINPMKKLAKIIIGVILLLGPLAVTARAGFVFQSSGSITSPGAANDAVNSMAVDPFGFLYVAGYMVDPSDSRDVWVAKFDSNNVLVASDTFDGGGQDLDEATGIILNGSDVFVTGFVSTAAFQTSRNIFLARYNTSLVLQSSSSVDVAGNMDGGLGLVHSASDGRVYVVGVASLPVTGEDIYGEDIYVGKFNAVTCLELSNTLVDVNGYNRSNQGNAITVDASNRVYITGSTEKQSTPGDYDIFTARLVAGTMAMQSSHTYVGTGNGDEGNGIVLNGGESKAFVVGIDGDAPERHVLLRYDISGGNISYDTPSSPVFQSGGTRGNGIAFNTINSRLFTAGFDGGDLTVTASSDSLTQISSDTYDNGFGADEARAVAVAGSSMVFVGGITTGFTSGQDAAIFRYFYSDDPNDPSDLRQYYTTLSSQVFDNGVSNSSFSIVLRGIVNDLEGDQVKLQVELINTGFSPTGFFTHAASSFVASGDISTITITGLTPGTSYYWRARTIDDIGATSNWVDFNFDGGGADTDFVMYNGERLWDYLCCGSQDASRAANWEPAEIPQNGDSLLFNGISTNNMTWDLPGVSLSSVTLDTGYTGVITASTNMTINGQITIRLGTLELSSNTVPVNGDILIDHDPCCTYATLDLGNGSQDIAGNITLNGLYSKLMLSSGSHFLHGDITNNGSPISMEAGEGQVTLSNTVTQTLGGSGILRFHDFIVNTSSEVVMAAGSALDVFDFQMNLGVFDSGFSSNTLSGNMSYSAGTMLNVNSTWTMTGSSTQTLDTAITWGNLDIDKVCNSSATVTFVGGGIPFIERNLVVGQVGACGNEGLDISTETAVRHIQIGGSLDVENNNNFHIFGSTVEFINTTTESVRGLMAGPLELFNVIVNKPNGRLDWEKNLDILGNFTLNNGLLGLSSDTHTLEGHFNQPGGNFNPSTGTFRLDENNFHEITMASGSMFWNLEMASGTMVLKSTIAVSNDFEWQGGTIDMNAIAPPGDFHVRGDWNQLGCSAKTMIPGGEVIFDGSALQFISSACGDAEVGHVRINSSNEVEAVTNVNFESFLLENGTFDANSGFHDVKGEFIQTGGVFDPDFSEFRFNGTGVQGVSLLPGASFYNFTSSGTNVRALTDFKIGSNFNLSSGTFDTNGSTITLVRAFNHTGGSFLSNGQWIFESNTFVDQTIDMSTFTNVKIDKTDGWNVVFSSGLYAFGDVEITSGSRVDFNFNSSTFEGDLTSSGTFLNTSNFFFAGPNPATVFTSAASTFSSINVFVNKDPNVSLTALSALDIDNGTFTIQGGTFTAGDFVHTVEKSIIQTGGYLNPGLGTFRMDGTTESGPPNDTVQLLPGSSFHHLDIFADVTTALALTVEFKSDLVITGDLNIDKTVTTGILTVDPGSYTHRVGGNLTVTGGNIIFNPTTGTFRLDGAALQTIKFFDSASDGFYNFTVAGTSVAVDSVLDIDGSVSIEAGEFVPGTYTHLLAGDFSVTGSGVFDPSTGTFQFDGGVRQNINMVNPGPNHFFNFKPVSGSSMVAVGDVGIDGLLDLSDGPGVRFNPNGNTTFLGGDVLANVTANLVPSGTYYFNGGVAQTITNQSGQILNMLHFVVDAASVSVSSGDILDIDGNFSLLNGTFTLSNQEHFFEGDWTESGGNFVMNAGTVTFDGNNSSNLSQMSGNGFYNLNLGGSGSLQINTNIEVNGDFSHNSGFLTNTQTVVLGGDFNECCGGWDPTGAWEFDGFGTQTIEMSTFQTVGITNSAGSVIFVNGLNATFGGSGDVLLFPGSVVDLAGNGEMFLAGKLSSSGTFVNMSTVVFSGGNPQTIWMVSGSTLTNVLVNKTVGTDLTAISDLDINGNVKLQNGSFVSGNNTHYIMGDFTIAGGSITAGGVGQVNFDGGVQKFKLISGDSGFNSVNVYSGSTLRVEAGNLGVETLTILAGGIVEPLTNGVLIGQDLNVYGTLMASGTITFDGSGNFQTINSTSPFLSFNNLVVGDSPPVPSSVTTNVELDINNDFTVLSGTFTLNPPSVSTFVHTLAGNLDAANGRFVMTAGTFTFDGNSNQTISVFNDQFFHLNVAKLAGTRLTANNDSLDVDGNFNLAGGTFVAGNYTHNIEGNWNQSPGTFFPGRQQHDHF